MYSKLDQQNNKIDALVAKVDQTEEQILSTTNKLKFYMTNVMKSIRN